MIDSIAVNRVIDAYAVDPDGRRLGRVVQVYLDDWNGRPAWATIHAEAFGTQAAVVPLAEAELMGNSLRVPFDKELVDHAPRVDLDRDHLSLDEETGLRSYYEGISQVNRTVGASPSNAGGTASTVDGAMIRSEERLRVGTEWVTTERVRVRKVIVTENVTVTVPVSREEIRVEREPITGGDLDEAAGAPAPSGAQVEFIAYAQRPVVTMEVIPVERVRVSTVMVSGQESVTDSIRKEKVTADTDMPFPPGAGSDRL